MAIPKLLKKLQEDLARIEAKIDAMMTAQQMEDVNWNSIPQMPNNMYEPRLPEPPVSTVEPPKHVPAEGTIPGLTPAAAPAPATSESLPNPPLRTTGPSDPATADPDKLRQQQKEREEGSGGENGGEEEGEQGIQDFDVNTYTDMTVGEIMKEAKLMTPEQRKQLLEHEESHQNRRTLVGALVNWNS